LDAQYDYQEDSEMYSIVLTLHSLVRWIVVILALAAVVRAFIGWLGKQAWTPLDDRLGMWYTISLDVQLLLGLVLYIFLSPLAQAAFRDFGAAMSNPVLRFFAVEHILTMVVAVILAHVGRALSRRATEAQARHRRAVILYGLATLVILVAVPWPFMTGVGRPWIRLG